MRSDEDILVEVLSGKRFINKELDEAIEDYACNASFVNLQKIKKISRKVISATAIVTKITQGKIETIIIHKDKTRKNGYYQKSIERD